MFLIHELKEGRQIGRAELLFPIIVIPVNLPSVLIIRGVKVNLYFFGGSAYRDIYDVCACFVRALVVYKNNKIWDVLIEVYHVCMLCQGLKGISSA